MKRHHAKIVQYILGGLILLHYLILELSEEDLPWWYLFLILALLIGFFVFRFPFWRCPSCGSYLHRTSGEYSQYCGKTLYGE